VHPGKKCSCQQGKLYIVSTGNFAINGIPETDDLLVEFRKIHPEIDQDIVRFYKLATEQPAFFSMVIQNLRKMV
jgi:hypothetical protein